MSNKGMAVAKTVSDIAAHGSTSQQRTTEELVEAIGNSNDVLARVNTVFPFAFFPSTLTVDRTKLTITERDFFKTGEVLSIRIEDILNVTAHVGPFLGSIKISTRFFNPEKPYIVDKLKRADALMIKRILQGYLIARQNNIDCSSLPTDKLAVVLDELGKVGPEEKV